MDERCSSPLIFTSLVLGKSLFDFTRTGPQMTDEVLVALSRSTSPTRWRRLASYRVPDRDFCWPSSGVVGLRHRPRALRTPRYQPARCRGRRRALAILRADRRACSCARCCCRPGCIAVVVAVFDDSFLSRLWERLTPAPPARARRRVLFGALGAWAAPGWPPWRRPAHGRAFWLLVAHRRPLRRRIPWLATRNPEPAPAPRRQQAVRAQHPADRLGYAARRSAHRSRAISATSRPILDGLARTRVRFTDCYVPCARTAPSLASLLTRHLAAHARRARHVRHSRADATARSPSLPGDSQARPVTEPPSSATGRASDAEKFPFGFEYKDLPPDQWNIKYLLRQGPKDIRLFLSLFTQNRFGKIFLPEIYYLGGHPLTEEVGRDTRRMIAQARQRGCAVFPGVLHGDHPSAVHFEVPVLLAVLRSRVSRASPSSAWPSCAIRGKSSAARASRRPSSTSSRSSISTTAA